MAEERPSIKFHDCPNALASDCKSGVIIDHQPNDRSAIVTIDHRYFPHIIDLILSFLSYPGLIRCSGVCRSWRERVLSRLFDHVALFEPGQDGGLTEVWSRNLDWPNMTTNLISADSHNPNAFQSGYPSSTVDLFSKPFHRSPEDGFPWKRPRAYLRLLQATAEANTFSPSNKLGFSIDDLGSDVVHFTSYDQGQFTFGIQTPSYPKTVTITVGCYENPTQGQSPQPPAVWPHFEEFQWEVQDTQHVSIVLLNLMDTGAHPPHHMHNTVPSFTLTARQATGRNRGYELDALGELILYVAWLPYVESVGVIGVEKIVGTHSRVPYMQNVCDVIVELIDWAENTTDSNGLPAVEDLLRFYTHEQFLGNVGEERYRLVTVQ